MNLSKPLLVSLGVVAGMLAASVWAWPHAPASVPVHWGMSGTPDRFGSRLEALGALPAVAAVLAGGFAALPSLMPRTGRLERSAIAYVAVWLATLSVLAAIHAVMICAAVGAPLEMARVVGVAVGALFVVLGNYLGKVRYNYVVGLRLPWTLASERVWDRTHRFAGPLVLAGGLVLIAAALIAPAGAQGARLTFAAILICALAPVVAAAVYSWRLSRTLDPA